MEFLIGLERPADVPLHRCLSNAIKSAIEDGRLRPGEKLASVRTLCEVADVSKNTAHQCYQTLIGEGYLEAVQGKGIFVSKPLSNAAGEPPAGREPVREPVRKNASKLVQTPLIETIYGLEEISLAHQRAATALRHQMPSLQDLPLQQLKRVLTKHAKLPDEELLVYTGDPFGHPLLREAVSKYVLRARGIKCKPEQVVILSRPSQQMLDMLCRLFLGKGDNVVVEHPGYSQPRQIFQLHGANVIPIAVDEAGLDMDALKQVREPVKMVYVTPSHQDPTGAVLSQARRQQLVDWAAAHDAIIWEDDVDNEYRYGVDALPALFAMERSGHVVYQSTFWRTLCPLVRLGFVILPEGRMREIVHLAKYLLDRDLPILEQLALADLINEGHFENHVRTMRKKFSVRRQTAVHELTMKLNEVMTINRITSGLHLRTTFDASIPKEVIVQCASESGLPMTVTDAFYVTDAPLNEFLIKFAHDDENVLRGQCERFAELLKARI